MKKVIFSLIAIAVMALGFVSCGNGGDKGDGKGGDAKTGIVGNWYYNDNTYYTFNEDGTGSYTAFGTLFGNFTYTEGDGTLTLSYEGTTQPSNYNIKLEGKKLTILEGADNFGGDTEYTRK